MDNWLCRNCLVTKATHVHHLTYENTGNEDIENDLISYCSTCHNSVHTSTKQEPKDVKFDSIYYVVRGGLADFLVQSIPELTYEDIKKIKGNTPPEIDIWLETGDTV